MQMNIQTDINGYVYFNDILYSLMKRAYASKILGN